MSGTPRKILDDTYAQGTACALCGQAALHVQHADHLPDYVACTNCGAAFVVEDNGERVMYGKIPAAYPATSRFALRQWVWLEAVARRASAEHPRREAGTTAELELPPARMPPPRPERMPPPAPPHPADHQPVIPAIPPEPAAVVPVEEPAANPVSAPASRTELFRPMQDADLAGPAAYLPGAMRGWSSPNQDDSPETAAEAAAAPSATPPFTDPADLLTEDMEWDTASSTEPTPGRRYRVVITGDRVSIPSQPCAHCLGTPVRGKLAVVGTVPRSTAGGRRRQVSLELPLCANCHRRASAARPEERSLRLQAHLVSGVVALGVLIGSIALRLVDLSSDPIAGALILAILASLGYALPLLLLLGRAGRLPLPEDSIYVRTTLLIPRDVEGLATAFEWRNSGFARAFHEANAGDAIGGVVEIVSQG